MLFCFIFILLSKNKIWFSIVIQSTFLANDAKLPVLTQKLEQRLNLPLVGAELTPLKIIDKTV